MDRYATLLEVDIFPMTPEYQDKEQERCVRELLKRNGFSVTGISEEMGGNPILSDAFIATDEILSAVHRIREKLEEWYPKHDVSYDTTHSDFYRETAVFEQIQLISVEHTTQGTIDRTKMTELPGDND